MRRLLAIADTPDDTDDRRLQKRIGVVAGYLTIVAPLGAPPLAGWHPLSLVLAPFLSVWSVANLVVLARTRRFERYVVLLIIGGEAFTLMMDVLLGGVTSGAGMLWTFLVPVYAMLSLGPRRAIPWFGVYVGGVLLAVALDPFLRDVVPVPPYPVQLVSTAQNLLVPVAITFVFLYYTDSRRRAAEARSDELLTNAIPVAIARRLQHGEDRIAEAYPETTVLFADLAGFTPWAGATDPDRVVELLDDLFSRFDAQATACGMEKIKTIGDAYMAAAGAPQPRADHAEAALSLATAMLAAVGEWRREHGVELEVRIGIASGPVVGGVIGDRRLLFDLWGDTVNTASRMESSGVPGRIQVADATYRLLRATHPFTARDLDVKGIGPVTAYLLEEGTS